MAVPANVQAEGLSLIHQFMLGVDKSLAAEILKKTKAKPRANNLPTLVDIVAEYKKKAPAQKPAESSSDDSSDDEAQKKQAPKPAVNSKLPAAKKKQGSDSSEEEQKVAQKPKAAAPAKPAVKKAESSDDSDSRQDESDESTDDPARAASVGAGEDLWLLRVPRDLPPELALTGRLYDLVVPDERAGGAGLVLRTVRVRGTMLLRALPEE